MKKTILTALTIAMIALVSAGAFAADTSSASATLTLYGTVPKYVSITCNQTDGTSGSPIDLVNGSGADEVATVVEKGNTAYTVTLTSGNGGKFVGATSGNSMSYTVKYGNDSFTPSTTATTITNASAKTAKNGADAKTLTILYTPDAANTATDFLTPGDTYSDALTFTITAK